MKGYGRMREGGVAALVWIRVIMDAAEVKDLSRPKMAVVEKKRIR
jgi:hypothetical protein